MADRISALDGHITKGRFGRASADQENAGVTISLVADLKLHQIAAWPDNIKQVGDLVSSSLKLNDLIKPCSSIGSADMGALRIEPLKWWIVGADAPEIDAEIGANLDLSHSRTRLRIAGPEATTLLNRLLPLDLREASFKNGAVASSAIHHVGTTLWRNEAGYDIFVPRGFALSIWELIYESSLQFGVEVV